MACPCLRHGAEMSFRVLNLHVLPDRPSVRATACVGSAMPCSSASCLVIALLIARRAEEMLEVSLGRIQEVPRDEVVLGLTVGDLTDGVAVQTEESRTRVAQDDG